MRNSDCSLPSLFGACHEEPYRPGAGGFGEWPRTKWSWSFELAERPGVVAPKIHKGKTLYLAPETVRLADPIVRAESTGSSKPTRTGRAFPSLRTGRRTLDRSSPPPCARRSSSRSASPRAGSRGGGAGRTTWSSVSSIRARSAGRNPAG
jgi:hypothetical protein